MGGVHGIQDQKEITDPKLAHQHGGLFHCEAPGACLYHSAGIDPGQRCLPELLRNCLPDLQLHSPGVHSRFSHGCRHNDRHLCHAGRSADRAESQTDRHPVPGSHGCCRHAAHDAAVTSVRFCRRGAGKRLCHAQRTADPVSGCVPGSAAFGIPRVLPGHGRDGRICFFTNL